MNDAQGPSWMVWIRAYRRWTVAALLAKDPDSEDFARGVVAYCALRLCEAPQGEPHRTARVLAAIVREKKYVKNRRGGATGA